EARDEPPLAWPSCPDLPDLGRRRVLGQEVVVDQPRPVRRGVEGPGPRLLVSRTDVDPGGVLDRLLRADDVVVLEVPQRIEKAVPLPAGGVRRRGVGGRRCLRSPSGGRFVGPCRACADGQNAGHGYGPACSEGDSHLHVALPPSHVSHDASVLVPSLLRPCATRRIAAPRALPPRRGRWWAVRSNRNAVPQLGGPGRRAVTELSRILPLGHVVDGCRARDVLTGRRLLPSEWAAGLILVLLWACGQAASTPAAGPPARIVSLAPSTTEIVFGLGGGDRVVA